MIDSKIIEEVKNRIDIVEVIGDFVQLKKAGQNYKALSPFTDEKTASFFVSPSKEIFKCFSTGKGGDAITFVMEHDGLSYIEAIKYLAQKYGIEIAEEEQSEEAVLAQNERESIFIALNFACEYFHSTLKEHTEGQSVGLSYFKERGYDLATIDKFKLGYSLEEWSAFTDHAIKQGYSEVILEKAGLLIKKEDGKQYDRFRGRVIFPIHNLSGKVIAFGARTLKKDKKLPKYVNSPESEVYHKSDILYGLYLAKKRIREDNNCFLVEGYTDVISLHLSGIENVVSSSGTSLTEEQIKLISRFTKNVTVLFDGDKAGLRAAIRGIDMILESDLNVRVVVFPDGEDPDSYSRKLGSSGFQDYLKNNTKDFIRFKAKLLADEAANDPIKKAETIKEIVHSIAKIPDPIKRSVYVKETSEVLGIDEQVLLAEQNKILINLRKERSKKAERETEEQNSSFIQDQSVEKSETNLSHEEIITLQERESVRLLITYGMHDIEEENLGEFMLAELEEIEFVTPVYKEMLEVIKTELQNGNKVNAEFLIHNSNPHIKREVVDMISEKYLLSTEWKDKYEITVPGEEDNLSKMVVGNILRLKFRVVQKMMDDNLDKMKHAESEKEQHEAMQMYQRLKEAEMQIAKQLGIVISR